MRLYASDSVSGDHVSALAIAECLFAVLLYLALSIYLGTSLPLSIAVAAAPFFLLRTTRSTEMALLRWYGLIGKMFGWVDRLDTYIQHYSGNWKWLLDIFAAFFVAMLFMPSYIMLSGMACRVCVTAWCTLRHPFESLRSIPGNWYRQALCTDLSVPPEIVPGEASSDLGVPNFRNAIRTIRAEGSLLYKFGVGLPALLLTYVPALLLRLSFKASSFAYLPFVWATYTSLNNTLPIAYRLQRAVNSELEKFRRGVCFVIITVLALEALYALGVMSPDEMSEQLKDPVLVRLHCAVLEWPPLKIFLLVEAALTYFLLFFSDTASARLAAGQPWPDRTVTNIFETASLIRAGFAILAILVALVFAYIHIVQFFRSGPPAGLARRMTC